MKTFNELCGLGWNKNKMIAYCGGGDNDSSSGGSDSSSNDNDNDSGGGGFFGYDSLTDMFDGGGPGMSGDSFSTVDNSQHDSDGDGHISDSEALAGTGSVNLSGGLDGSNTSETDLITSNLSDDEFWEEFESGTNTMNTSTGNITTVDDSGSNPVGGNNDETPSDFYGGDSGVNVFDMVSTINTGSDATNAIINGNDTTNTGTDTTTNTGTDTTTNTGTDDTNTNTGSDDTTTNNNSLIDDLNAQIADLQNQLNSMSSSGGNTIVYEGAGDTNTSLPDDYLTEADLARYLDNLDLGSNAYDPAAFLNAYGFALDPSMMGGLIPTFTSNNGLFERRAVRDKDTGEIRYVNVPIGPGAVGGNTGLSAFQRERRAGFGNLL